MILLDTNVISETMRARPDERVLAWLDGHDPTNLYITAITVQELTFGAHCLAEGRRKTALVQAIGLVIDEDFSGRVLPYDGAAARLYGERVAEARRLGVAIGAGDGQIAAIALAYGVPVATRDHAPFEALEVPVIDPWSADEPAG